MLLVKNGRASSSKRTRHIDIRYFFVTDRIASGDVSVAYCPTADMIADFFTKPLQGAPFRQFRDFIMNIDPDYTAAPAMNPRSVLEIENQENTINMDNVKHSDVAPGTWIPVKQKKRSISSDRDARTSARHRASATG